MLEAVVFDKEGKKTGEVKLVEDIFGETPNEKIVHQYVTAYLANQRQGTVARKNRSEVRGGGVKPWRQKGTGRARVGSIRSPIWVGGGRAFPPQPREFYTNIPKKAKRKALKSALSFKAKTKKIKILEDINLDSPQTRIMGEMLSNLGVYGKKCLFLCEKENPNLYKSCRNIENLSFKRASLVNAYDLANCEYLLLTKDALGFLEEALSK